jgi:glucans biosynthesis protein
MDNQSNNPMQPEPANLANAPRCLARARSGTACQSPAMKGKKRCRLHGGLSTGAPKGNQNARKHGGYSAKTKEAVRFLKAVARIVRDVEP